MPSAKYQSGFYIIIDEKVFWKNFSFFFAHLHTFALLWVLLAGVKYSCVSLSFSFDIWIRLLIKQTLNIYWLPWLISPKKRKFCKIGPREKDFFFLHQSWYKAKFSSFDANESEISPEKQLLFILVIRATRWRCT